jgi:hypothetical protein
MHDTLNSSYNIHEPEREKKEPQRKKMRPHRHFGEIVSQVAALRIVFEHSSIFTLSTSISPRYDLPLLNLVCVRLQSPQALALCLS